MIDMITNVLSHVNIRVIEKYSRLFSTGVKPPMPSIKDEDVHFFPFSGSIERIEL